MITTFLVIALVSFILSSISLLVLMLNTVHSLLLLIQIFLFGSILLFFFKVEFLGLIFLMIYLGAILVLFLFVVMMLDIKTTAVQNEDPNLFFIKGIFIWFFLPIFIWWLFGESIFLSNMWVNFSQTNLYWTFSLFSYDFYQLILTYSNLEVIGWFIFDFEPFLFLLSGIILYISMIGSIVISLDHINRDNQKLQNIMVQVMRQGNLVYYFNTSVPKLYGPTIMKLHWGMPRFKKRDPYLWVWIGKLGNNII